MRRALFNAASRTKAEAVTFLPVAIDSMVAAFKIVFHSSSWTRIWRLGAVPRAEGLGPGFLRAVFMASSLTHTHSLSRFS